MHRSVSLRTFLTLPFLLIFLAAAGAISWISYSNALTAVERFQRQFAGETALRIHTHLQRFFAIPLMVAEFNRDALQQGRLDPRDLQALIQPFVSQMRQLPFLTFVSFGAVDGQYVGASRSPQSNEPELMTALRQEGMRLDSYAVDANDARGELLLRGPEYDARTRPWMKLARERNDVFWYPVYRYRIYQSLGMGVAAAIRDADGQWLGTLTADVALDQISRYLQQQPIDAGGVAFVAERDGQLIASSTGEPLFQLEGERIQRQRLRSHPNPLLAAAGERLGDGVGGQQMFRVGEQRYLLELRPLRDAHGLDLLIGVILPERAFSALVEESARLALWLTLGAILIGAGIGALLTRWVATPIERISVAASRLAHGETEAVAPMQSPVTEVNNLATSFESMAHDLRGLIDHLESRVAERTKELRTANVELERLSTLDGLTGIANRRRFDQVLESEWQRGLRRRQPLALLLCDVDEFKRFNDHHGHHEGDHVLQQIAQVLADCARRPADLAARYGGEEFAMILPDIELPGALALGELLCSKVREAQIRRADGSPRDCVTLSVGVACVVPNLEFSPDRLIEDADKQLYRAKDAGRDRVMPGESG